MRELVRFLESAPPEEVPHLVLAGFLAFTAVLVGEWPRGWNRLS